MTGPQGGTAARQLRGFWLGRRSYAPIHELMDQLREMRRRDQIGDVVLLLEHEPVITHGRGARAEHVLAASDELERLGVSVAKTGRGGDVTLHAPGQLVAYPIVDLNPDRRDVRKYVQGLTRVMQELVSPAGLSGGTVSELIGLWIDRESPNDWPGEPAARKPAKIGAIGVRISRWITSHGFALNLRTDLSLFQLIVPCGISQWGVTSVEALCGRAPAPVELAPRAHELIAAELGRIATVFEDLSDLDERLRDRIVSRCAEPPRSSAAQA